jgi:hypothetical protein
VSGVAKSLDIRSILYRYLGQNLKTTEENEKKKLLCHHDVVKVRLSAPGLLLNLLETSNEAPSIPNSACGLHNRALMVVRED